MAGSSAILPSFGSFYPLALMTNSSFFRFRSARRWLTVTRPLCPASRMCRGCEANLATGQKAHFYRQSSVYAVDMCIDQYRSKMPELVPESTSLVRIS